ncbi:aladin-like isoform X2 [Octopus vulgaris]|uniref:Aladin-like isoform X2 n=1 Tax=Octopus vulgaris TaxID=6645 RepID=A0AA36BVG8_OCTVU|nr:aladin-like isoform X2 [Octopus vulgaris]
MQDLLNFPPVPDRDFITLGERNGDIVHVPADRYEETKLPGYPDVSLSKDFLRVSQENSAPLFLAHEETLCKKALNAWYETGLSEALAVLNRDDGAPSLVSAVASGILTVIRWAKSIHPLISKLTLSTDDIINQYSSPTNWSPGIICSFAWHPHALKFAYALIDDSVKVHTGGMSLVPILRTKLQKNVIDLAWQPFSSSVLAVACRSCILIWHVEPMSLAERPSASCVQILQQDHHSPVSSLGWSPSGDLLLSASPIDTAVMVWNVAMEAVVPLRRIGGGGNTMVCWSPDGFRVMSATPGSVFRVWQTKTWGCDKWTLPSGRCQTACWSPDGSTLLFATDTEPLVYAVTFSTNKEAGTVGGNRTAEVFLDLSLVSLTSSLDEDIKIGGCVQSLVWDPTGSRLALLFKESFGCKKNLIAVFRTTKSPSLKATPCGWVKGEEGDSAQFICFKPKFQDGALLTVVWSSGRISQVPFYFLVPDKISSGGPLQMAPQFGPQPDCLLFSSAMSDLD